MTSVNSLVNAILQRVHAVASAGPTILRPADPCSPAPDPHVTEPAFPTEWFDKLAKSALPPAPKRVSASTGCRPTAARAAAVRVTPSTTRPRLALPVTDLGTGTVVIMPIYRASPEAMQLGTYHVLADQGTTFVGLLMQIGTSCICWSASALPPTTISSLASLGVTTVDGGSCPEPLTNALAAGAVAVCADYELTIGFYRRTGWPSPCRWHDLLATSSALNFPSDLIGVAMVMGNVALPEAVAGLQP